MKQSREQREAEPTEPPDRVRVMRKALGELAQHWQRRTLSSFFSFLRYDDITSRAATRKRTARLSLDLDRLGEIFDS